MRMLARLALYIAASVFAGFGVLFMVAPGQITGFVQVAVPTPIAAMEIRGVYGGLFFGLGVFFALCATLSYTALRCLLGVGQREESHVSFGRQCQLSGR